MYYYFPVVSVLSPISIPILVAMLYDCIRGNTCEVARVQDWIVGYLAFECSSVLPTYPESSSTVRLRTGPGTGSEICDIGPSLIGCY
jgi:hypothetical protein